VASIARTCFAVAPRVWPQDARGGTDNEGMVAGMRMDGDHAGRTTRT